MHPPVGLAVVLNSDCVKSIGDDEVMVILPPKTVLKILNLEHPDLSTDAEEK